MQIVSISWVRNEADIIEAFVRHHCAVVDRMIIIDHRSIDSTRSILHALKNEGLPLDVRQDGGFIHRQGEALSTLLQECTATGADVVVPLDADEFLSSHHPGSLRSTLERLPADCATAVPWRSYVPLPTDDEHEPHILRRIQNRKIEECPQWHKVIIPRALIERGVRMDIGSHALLDGVLGCNVETTHAHNLFLGHFPVRSSDQIAGKVLGGWLSHLANPKRLPGAIFQWKAIFDRIRSGAEIGKDELQTLAMEYATSAQWNALPTEEQAGRTLGAFVEETKNLQLPAMTVFDPMLAPHEMRYTPHRASSMHILMGSAEYLAQAYAKQPHHAPLP